MELSAGILPMLLEVTWKFVRSQLRLQKSFEKVPETVQFILIEIQSCGVHLNFEKTIRVRQSKDPMFAVLDAEANRRVIENIEAELMHRTVSGSIDHKTEQRPLAYFTEIIRIKCCKFS